LPGGAWLASLGAAALLLLVSPRYGFHRDELYFIVAGRRLDWGYVDQPPLTPLVARAAESVFGTSPFALRILPALAVALVALLAALMARRFGAGRSGQAFAAFTVGFVGVLLGEGHLLSTAVFDFALWTLGLWLLVQILDDADPRIWLAVGGVVGVGLLNKHTMAFFALAVLVGILSTRQRRRLASIWPWLGVLMAAALALPNVIWQANNGWPQLDMAEALRDRSEGALAFLLFQPLLLSVALAVPAAAGLWWLARSEEARRWRPIPIAYGFLIVLFLVTGGKAYYVAPMYSALLAGGAVWFGRLSPRRRVWMGIAAGLGVAVGLLIALPIMPISNASTFDLTGELGETAGWPTLIDQVDVVQDSIPIDSRGDTVVFTGAYGEAGAVDVLGRDAGLPPAASGHNNYWRWGPPEPHRPIIGVGRVETALAPICPQLEQIDTLGNPNGVENEVLGQPLWLCLEPSGQLADIWDSVRHYN
jgi:4-amino-4-deoxy-L-arabinose transferase-like glycosyltransferase